MTHVKHLPQRLILFKLSLNKSQLLLGSFVSAETNFGEQIEQRAPVSFWYVCYKPDFCISDINQICRDHSIEMVKPK